jgi:type II secretory pathway predicted ATPase ExeA
MSNDPFTISEEERDYSMYGLEKNPFPYSPVPDDNPEVYCGQDHVAEAVSDTISTVLGTGKSKHLVITGKYGNGKSHTLKYARSLVRDREDVLVGYVAQPGEGFLDIYHEFMYDVGFDEVQSIAYEFLAQVARDETDKNPTGPDGVESLINDGEVLLSELVPTAVQRLSDITKFADFARAIVHMVYEDTNLYAWQWLTAEGIRYEQRKEMEIHSALDDDTMGVRAFTSFKNLLLELGYTGVFVFIDEFEAISRLSSKDKQATLNSIRHLMDQNGSGLSILFACAPEVWQDVMTEYHAFSERIGNEVALRPLTEDDLTDLISNYLNTVRRKSADGIDPFDSESLDQIHQFSQGNIRQVLSICGQAIDHGIEKGESRISPKIVEQTISR